MSVPSGSIRFNTDSAKMEIYNGEQWWEIDSTSPELQTGGTRGIYFGGVTPSAINNIDFYNVDTTGNAADFGDLTQNVFMCTGVSDSTRGIRGGGATPSPANTDTIDFVTIASDGNATDFGNLTTANQRSGGMSNRTRGLFSGGEGPSGDSNIIDYVTHATLGNAVDFGDDIFAILNVAGSSDSHGGLGGF